MEEKVWNKIPKTKSSSSESVNSKTLKRFSTLRITKSTDNATELGVKQINVNMVLVLTTFPQMTENTTQQQNEEEGEHGEQDIIDIEDGK